MQRVQRCGYELAITSVRRTSSLRRDKFHTRFMVHNCCGMIRPESLRTWPETRRRLAIGCTSAKAKHASITWGESSFLHTAEYGTGILVYLWLSLGGPRDILDKALFNPERKLHVVRDMVRGDVSADIEVGGRCVAKVDEDAQVSRTCIC